MKFPLGPMTVGDIFDRSLKLLMARFPAFAFIALVVHTPILVYQLTVVPELLENTGGDDPLEFLMNMLVSSMGVILLSVVFQMLGTAATLHIVAKEFVDEPVGVGEAFQTAFSRFGVLLGTSLLVGLLTGVGFLACCIPGFFILTWYAFVSQIIIMEGLGVGDSMSRSKELGEGFYSKVFGLLILLGLISFAINFAAGQLSNVLPYMEVIEGPRGIPKMKFISYENYLICTVVTFVFQIIAHSFQAVAMTLLYFDLRIRKEGFDLDVAMAKDQDDPWASRPREDEDEPPFDSPDRDRSPRDEPTDRW